MAFNEIRGKWGEEFEKVIFNDLIENGFEVCWMKKNDEYWTYYLDSRYGDLCINNKIFIDVKRSWQISETSLKNFIGYYYILGSRDMNLNRTFVFKRSIINNLPLSVKMSVIMSSGEEGYEYDINNIKEKMLYISWRNGLKTILKNYE